MPASDGRVNSSFEPIFLFVLALAAYVSLQTLATLASSGLLKALSYAAAFVIVLVMSAVAAFLPRQAIKESLGFGFALLLYFYGFIGAALFHSNALDYGTAIKMMLVPTFVMIGAAFETQNRFSAWDRQNVKWLFALLLVLPFLLWLWQLASGKVVLGGAGDVSFFANRNNAGLYAVSLVALLNVLRPQPLKNLFVYFLVGASFGTLGVLLAVLAALVLAVGRWKLVLLLGMLIGVAVSILYLAPLDFGVFARVKHVVASILLIVSGRIEIATVTYGDLVNMLHTKDLSFIFRLKHWLDFGTMYVNAPIENIVFGFGVGSSARLSEAGIIPHNDYLRMLFECGPVTFAGFVSLIVLMLKSCWRQWEVVPLLAVSIYFFTENLIDNFSAMSIFFFCGGALAYRLRFGRRTVAIRPETD